MALVSFDPVENLLRLQEELDRFFGKPAFDLGVSGPSVFPPVNVFGDQDGVVIRAEVPGIKRDQIHLEVEPRRLTVSGERAPVNHKPDGSYHRRERRPGAFSRSLQLPADLDISKAVAECRNGILTIRIPRSAQAKPRRIDVQAA